MILSKKSALSIFLVMLLTFTLYGCGGNSETYVVAKITNEDNIEVNTPTNMAAEDVFSITINGNKVSMVHMGMKEEGTCELNGENITITGKGSPYTGTLIGGTLTISQGKIIFVLKKK